MTHFAPVGESWELRVLAPAALARFLAYKGSITVNGVSLTVNSVTDRPDGCEFSINLIPHTLQNTTLGTLRVRAARQPRDRPDRALRRADAERLRLHGGRRERRREPLRLGGPGAQGRRLQSRHGHFPRSRSSLPSSPPAAW